jgi:hypothetical protein
MLHIHACPAQAHVYIQCTYPTAIYIYATHARGMNPCPKEHTCIFFSCTCIHSMNLSDHNLCNTHQGNEPVPKRAACKHDSDQETDLQNASLVSGGHYKEALHCELHVAWCLCVYMYVCMYVCIEALHCKLHVASLSPSLSFFLSPSLCISVYSLE